MKHDIRVTDTGLEGFHTGRPRYRLICYTCKAIIHEGTTGPGYFLKAHLEGQTAGEKPLPMGEQTPR
jgi:hypothetical protein